MQILPEPPENDNHVLFAINGELHWIPVTVASSPQWVSEDGSEVLLLAVNNLAADSLLNSFKRLIE